MTQFLIRLPNETHRTLKIYAATNGKSMNAVIGDLVQRYLAEIQKEVA